MAPATIVISVPDAALRAALTPPPAGVEILDWRLDGPAPRASIDIVVMPYMVASKLLGQLAQLATVQTRLVQSQSIGYDGVIGHLPPGLCYANAASVHETSTAELNLALILASQRGLPDFVRAAGRSEWQHAYHPSLADRTVLLVGYGNIGRATEERLRPFDVRIVRMARTARADSHGPIHGVEELPMLLPGADIVVVDVPLTDTTRRLVDARFLARMHDDALLVNTARGAVADTDAILAEARRGRLRFALDVTDPEPLPDGHPLFALRNVLITPHVGGHSTAMPPRMARLVRTQIERLRLGIEPLNVVVRTQGDARRGPATRA